RTGSPTARGCAKRDSAGLDVARAAPCRSAIGPRWACGRRVRECCRSASAARSPWRTICSQPSRPTTPANARARTPASTRTRVRRPVISSLNGGPDLAPVPPALGAPRRSRGAPRRPAWPRRRRASPGGEPRGVIGYCGHTTAGGGGKPGTSRHVLAREADLLTARYRQAELPRALLDPGGSAQRGHLDLE